MRVLIVILVATALLLSSCRSSRQESFASPDVAVEALISAVEADGSRELLKVLGEEAERTIASGDEVQDKNARQRFLQAFARGHELHADADGTITLLVGPEGWPFPFPLVQRNQRWHFDTAAGTEEIISRRVGANEIATIQSCLAFVDAQREYFTRNPDNAPLLHYAQRLVSTEGRRDGLYWPRAEGEAPSPLGERFARARSEGYFKEGGAKGEPLRGYLYRLLTAQGPHAAGGAYDYFVGGKMIGGFALIAFPVEYGSSGVKTFIVNHDAVVFSKDLGPDTEKTASAIKAFDPDPSWSREAPIEVVER